jgi:hypothetical protein
MALHISVTMDNAPRESRQNHLPAHIIIIIDCPLNRPAVHQQDNTKIRRGRSLGQINQLMDGLFG